MDFVENVGRRSKVEDGDNGEFINVGIFSLNGRERKALFRNLGNDKFVDVSYIEGCDLLEDGRGLGSLDADLDGDLDLILNNYLMPARLLINSPPAENHWLRLKLRGTDSNRPAIGARVLIQHGTRKQTREVTTCSGYLSSQSPYLHFGLGLEDTVDRLVIHWPSGRMEEVADLPANGFYEISEGQGKAIPIRRPGQPAAATPAVFRQE
jgi:hypothetical protein